MNFFSRDSLSTATLPLAGILKNQPPDLPYIKGNGTGWSLARPDFELRKQALISA